MISRLAPPSSTDNLYRSFLNALEDEGFTGELSTHYGDRTVLSTDNSIYQRLPQAVVFPRSREDVQLVARLAALPQFANLSLTPRGGGTGTNGQSLSDGLVVDISRHMNRIIEIDPIQRWARVHGGVVKDQLNAELKKHGLFFAPELSTSNRATIGGMINTDASGQGSCLYGKTRDHVLELGTVLLGGSYWRSQPLEEHELESCKQRDDEIGRIHRLLDEVSHTHQQLIAERFPKLNRCLTGYDLAHLRDDQGRLDLNAVLCGSEGTLGFIVDAKIRVLPIPRYSALMNVSYASFDAALRDAPSLMALDAASIETVDSKILQLARQDIIWNQVAEYFPERDDQPIQGVNLVEFIAEDAIALQAKLDRVAAQLQAAEQNGSRLGFTTALGDAAVKSIWGMRKKSVGLLGNLKGNKRPIPFVEDTAVPPEHLADFIAEFRHALDRRSLTYGMFGHVDAGVLHVRPAIDMRDPGQEVLVREITDEVVALTQKYKGLLWGEHGKGLRSAYAPEFFGPLYPVLQEIKAAFDPRNQLNPGKIATPPAGRLLGVDEVETRGQHDRQIDERVWQSYDTAVYCNGNGACYNYDPDDTMCPSWKATRQRAQSPKGRASLIREWLRLQGAAGVDVLAAATRVRQGNFLSGFPRRLRNSWARHRGQDDFSHEVYDAMAGCLACKSCAGQCPIKVNIPEFRSRFLELYHGRYLRPLKDYLIGSLEFTIPYLARVPALYNAVMGAHPVQALLRKYTGMVDSPLLSRFDLRPVLDQWQVRQATPSELAKLDATARARSVVLVQDAFTRYFDTETFAAWVELFSRLGYRVYLAPFLPNGKPLHVQGFLGAFEKAARRNASRLLDLQKYGISLVGLDPAMTLVYRQEYAKVFGAEHCPTVLLPQEWLLDVALPEIPAPALQTPPFKLLGHCTERTNSPSSMAQWRRLFARFQLNLEIPSVGCCGMSGTYGHEARNHETSVKIFESSWEPRITAEPDSALLLADGYSCRSQVSRLQQRNLRHPLDALLEYVRQIHR